jgi:hypothetical protein
MTKREAAMRPNGVPKRRMTRGHAMIASTAVLAMLSGCGKSTGDSSAAPPGARPDFTVKIDGKRRKCIVALSTEAQGSVIPCDEVGSFVKDELRLAGGSTYDLGTVTGSDEAETAKIRSTLDGAGFRSIGAR